MKNKPKETVEQVAQENAPAIKGKGGPGRGQGRHFHEMPLERLISIRLAPEDEADYRLMLKMTTPKSRFAILVAEAKRLQAESDREFLASVKAQTDRVASMLTPAEELASWEKE